MTAGARLPRYPLDQPDHYFRCFWDYPEDQRCRICSQSTDRLHPWHAVNTGHHTNARSGCARDPFQHKRIFHWTSHLLCSPNNPLCGRGAGASGVLHANAWYTKCQAAYASMHNCGLSSLNPMRMHHTCCNVLHMSSMTQAMII